MDHVNQTLYIPLYGKAYVSQKGMILSDKKAEEIWTSERFDLKRKSRSKWLAYYMGMRSAVFDRWLREKMEAMPEAVIVHLGCGMDSRICRVGTQGHFWFDIDFPDVIVERKKYYGETENYRMLPSDVRDPQWFQQIPCDRPVIIVMEGISMYLSPEELRLLIEQFKLNLKNCYLLMDVYTEMAAKASKYKNPINDVGVTRVYGLDDPGSLNISFKCEHDMTPNDLVDQLKGMEKWIFKSVFAGKVAKNLYRLYEFC